MKLHFKRGKREGLLPAPFYSLTTTPASATATATATATTQPMCSSPSHSQGPPPSSSPRIQSPPPNPQDEPHSPQDPEPINPAVQPDPAEHNPNPDHHDDDGDEEEEDPGVEADDDPDELDPDPDNPGASILSTFPPTPSSIDALVDPGATMVSTGSRPSLRRSLSKRKKGKVSVKKQQAIEKKLSTLLGNLKPIPFVPAQTLDFPKHEKLLKWLGLWDFCHIQFDRSVRVDLIAELIATYDHNSRCSYVKGLRIPVNRADLGRAFKLPQKNVKGGSVDVSDTDFETLSEGCIGFIEGFVSNWMLLHEDTWITPNEVLNWTRAIKDGHPEKVDWAGLLWLMVEKELSKGESLVDCYYASHLQHLIKVQREELMLTKPDEVVLKDTGYVDLDGVVLKEQDRVDLDAEEQEVEAVKESNVEFSADGLVLREEQDGPKLDVQIKQEKGADVKMGDVSGLQGSDALGGLNVELTLGPDVGENEDGKDAAMMGIEEVNEDGGEDLEQHQWRMRHCQMDDAGGYESFEESKEEFNELEGDEEAERQAQDGYDVGPSDDTVGEDGMTGNFLQAMEGNNIIFGSQGHLHGNSSIDLVDGRNELQHLTAGGMSFYNANGKREAEHEHDIHHHSLDGSNKRLRMDGPMDLKSLGFGTCVGQIQKLLDTTTMLHEEKERQIEQLNLHNQVLLNEVEKRESLIEHLQKAKYDEQQKRDAEMYRLQRELYLMGTLLDDYRKALKQTNKAFTEYRQKCQLPEEPIYRDVGPGGIVLSISEIEKQRLKKEEEYELNCTILEQKAKEAAEGYELQFREYLEKVHWLENRLTGFEKVVKELRELRSKPKVSEDQQQIVEPMETSEPPPSG